MKRKTAILKSVLLALSMVSATSADAQTKWKYTYDSTGNRTQRTITTGSPARQMTASSAVNLFPDGNVKAILDGGCNRLKIVTIGKPDAVIAIFDLSGRELISRHADSETTTIDINKLRHGTYVLSVELDNEKKTCKFNK